MQSPSEIYRLLVSLAAVNDADVFEEVVRKHSNEYDPRRVRPFLGIVYEVQQLIEHYDYTRSQAFLVSIRGRSPLVADMKRKIALEPINRKLHQQDFIQALMSLPEDRDVFLLIAPEHHETLDKVLIALEQSHRAFP